VLVGCYRNDENELKGFKNKECPYAYLVLDNKLLIFFVPKFLFELWKNYVEAFEEV